MNKKSIAPREKSEHPQTQSRTFRLRADEIAFLESLSGMNITAGLRKLITLGRVLGCSNNLVQTGGADITLAMISRIERLESQIGLIARAANIDPKRIEPSNPITYL